MEPCLEETWEAHWGDASFPPHEMRRQDAQGWGAGREKAPDGPLW